MLGRRSIRIKSMQTIFSLKTNPYLTHEGAEKLLKQSMQSYILLHDYVLYSALQVIEYINKDAEIKATKHIQTEEDKQVNVKLLSNQAYIALKENEEFGKKCEKNHFDQLLTEHVTRKVYLDLCENEKYNTYLANHLSDAKDDYKIFEVLVNDILMMNEIFQQNVEDHFVHFEDDYDFVYQVFQKTLNKATKTQSIDTILFKKNHTFRELELFASQLLLKTLDHDAGLEAELKPYLKNWDSKRLALIDTILLKMALSELLYFKEIPIKVTMNEYIDISKEYSTPKSKEFINGVLDKMMREFKAKGKIIKTGRGLN